MKFPRTCHLFNLGAATRDDLRMEKHKALNILSNSKLTLTAEEKVDGANLALKWVPWSKSFVGYNRSKTVFGDRSESDFQFRQLGQWIDSHTESLQSLLGGGNRILYGEWLGFKHNIHYTALYDYFLAFDILDSDKGKFLSRQRFNEEINRANRIEVEAYRPPIFTVPAIELTRPVTEDSLINDCLTAKSQFYDGPAEGIYLKWDEGDWSVDRAKLVRPDFQQELDNSEHWSKAIPVKNIVDYNKQYEMLSRMNAT